MNEKIFQFFIVHFIFFATCVPLLGFCLETDTISPGLFIRDPDTIVSRRQVFKLGFFTPEKTTNRYLGIFYIVSEKTVVWVANRDKPLGDSSSTVMISKDGNLVLINGKNQTVWSTNATTSPRNTSVQIHDTGNLVMRDDATGTIIWESFSLPSDVYLPTMRMIDNINTRKRVVLSAWKNASDPKVGSFTAGLDASNIPEIFIWNNGRPPWRSCPSNRQSFIGIQGMYGPYLYQFNLVNDQAGTVYVTASEEKFLMKFTLNSSGSLVPTVWNDQEWDSIRSFPDDYCDVYGTGGPFGSCNAKDSPICSCLRGFEPTNTEEWERGNWTSGCQMRKQLQCDQSSNTGGAGRNGDGFFRLQFMKLPDFAEQFPSRQEDECRNRCWRNCSCIAYAHDPNIGCMFWSDSLVDVRQFHGVGPDLYIRLLASELDNHKDKRPYTIIAVVVAFVSMLVFIFLAWCWMVKLKRKGDKTKGKQIFAAGKTVSSDSTAIVLKDASEKVNIEEFRYSLLRCLQMQQINFTKVIFLERVVLDLFTREIWQMGKKIAVKRLSVASGQGIEEFMNEVIVISKLQHRNLVRLLGCCVEKEERMLIYDTCQIKAWKGVSLVSPRSKFELIICI